MLLYRLVCVFVVAFSAGTLVVVTVVVVVVVVLGFLRNISYFLFFLSAIVSDMY